MEVWITSGGVVKQVVVVAPPTLPRPPASSDSESDVGASKDLPSPWQLVSKVQQSDDVEHILDKGVWAVTGAKQWAWKIFIKVSISFCSLLSWVVADLPCLGSIDDVSPNLSKLSGPLT